VIGYWRYFSTEYIILNLSLALSVAAKGWKNLSLALTYYKLRLNHRVELAVVGQNVVKYHLALQVIFVQGGRK